MIEIIYSPGGLPFQVDFERPWLRFKSPDPKTVKPPDLPPAQKPEDITSKAAKVGESETKRLRRRTGRRSTQLTGPSLSTNVPTAQSGLRTRLGGT